MQRWAAKNTYLPYCIPDFYATILKTSPHFISSEFTVYERILKQMREKIRTRHYVMTLHAEEEMDEDGLTIFDVERGVLTGAIIERQKDHDLGDWKYLVQGQTVVGQQVIVVAKLSPTNKLVIITVYLE
jgi:hypothetical protein